MDILTVSLKGTILVNSKNHEDIALYSQLKIITSFSNEFPSFN